MECFEQSSAQVLWLPAKEDAARYELQLDILDSMGSDHVSRYDHPSGIASRVAQAVHPIVLKIIRSFIRS